MHPTPTRCSARKTVGSTPMECIRPEHDKTPDRHHFVSAARAQLVVLDRNGAVAGMKPQLPRLAPGGLVSVPKLVQVSAAELAGAQRLRDAMAAHPAGSARPTRPTRPTKPRHLQVVR